MYRGTKKWSEAHIAKRMREGRGEGRGPSYKPWLTNADLSSKGLAHRMYSPKVCRVVELFSNIERDTFIAFEASPKVVDIREQYPLPRELTVTLADRLAVRHPSYVGTRIPVVMTVDMVVTVRESTDLRELAIDCKPSTDASNPRVLEKLEISRRACMALGMEYRLVFDEDLPREAIANLRWIRSAYLRDNEANVDALQVEQHKQALLSALAHADPSCLMHEFCRSQDRETGVNEGMSIRAIKLLLHERRLVTNLFLRHLWLQPLSAFHLPPGMEVEPR